MSKPFYANIENDTICNTFYRKVLYTSKYEQFVLMSIKPNDDIHMEVHKDHDQFIKIEKGTGEAIINNITYKLFDGIGLIIPAGFKHQIKNTNPNEHLKLFTIYSPPEHEDKLIQENNPDKLIHENNPDKYKNKYLKYKYKYMNKLS